MARPVNLLFVCTANVCRSPLAAGLMAFNAKQAGARVNVASGSTDQEIRGTHPTTVRMLHERGISLGRDHSQPLTPGLVGGSDLVLVMTAEHARAVVGRYPDARNKVFVMQHLAGELQPAGEDETLDSWLRSAYAIRRDYSRDEQWDIIDPNNESEAIYRAVEVQIDNATNWLATVISTLPA